MSQGQQRLRPCKHFLLGQITNLTTDCPYCMLEKGNAQIEDLANKIKVGTVTSASVIAGLEMALSQAAAMIERQQHVMQHAIDAWDTTTHQKNGDGRLWQCMEDLRAESHNAIYPA